MQKKLFLYLLFIISFFNLFSQQDNRPLFPKDIYKTGEYWADSVYKTLTADERIAQLFWIAIENPANKTTFENYRKQTETYNPGGIILFRMTPQKAWEVINDLQSVSKIPLLVSIDGENGLSMRMSDVVEFPNAMTLGAIQDNNLIFRMGLEIARQFRILGIHVNLAPVADVNNNPANPVIGARSYGENPENVSFKAKAYMLGLQQGGVMAVAKHFPGHGDTNADSHKTLPKINHNRLRLDSVELFPFKSLINAGVWGVMSAHLNVPTLEKDEKIPSSFSSNILQNILRKELGFNGLIITDAINMQGAKTMGKPGVVDALALAAGNDIVEFTENLPEAIKQTKILIESGKMSWDDIEHKCKKSLAFKHFLIYNNDNRQIAQADINIKLNSYLTQRINKKLNEAAVTMLVNDGGIIPLKNDTSVKWNYFILGNAPIFENEIKKSDNINIFKLPVNNDIAFDAMIKKAEQLSNVILVVADDRWTRNSANTKKKQQLLKLAGCKQSIMLFMGNAYNLSRWKGAEDFDGLLVTYQNTKEAQESISGALTGKFKISGQLPVSVSGMFKAGDGISTK